MLDEVLHVEGRQARSMWALPNKLGVGRIPLTVILTLFALSGWMLSFTFSRLWLWEMQAGWLQIGASALAGGMAALLALLLTAMALYLLRRPLPEPAAEAAPVVLGRKGVVRSASVDAHQGWAAVENEGAVLILRVRTFAGELPRGARVVVVQRLGKGDAWRVMSEEEFLSQCAKPFPASGQGYWQK